LFCFLLVNLSALVYQHSITPLALPIKLALPAADITEDSRSMSNQQQHETTKKLSVKDLLEKGAGKNLFIINKFFDVCFLKLILACNVLYLNNVDVESLSGQMALNKALRSTFDNFDRLQATTVHFKVSSTGITLTDTKKK
jgi:tensin